jgi:hypothetical protein
MQKLTEYAINVTEYNIDNLKPADYNPRQLTKDQYKQLTDSISAFGFVEPVVVNINTERLNIIISGHQRVKCAKNLGIKKVPCVELDLTLEQERELNVRMNKNTGEWDWDLLANGFDLDELLNWGFKDKDLKIFDDADDDEIEPEIEITAELFESHNYIVLYFDNDLDWQTAEDVFELKPVIRKNKKIGDKGLGRVIEGKKVLKKLL